MDKRDNEESEFSILKSILTANPGSSDEYDSQFKIIIKNVKKLIQNRRQVSMIEQLDQANFYHEVSAVHDTSIQAFNGLFFITLMVTQLFFRKWHWKFLYFASFGCMRLYIVEPILMEYKFRYLAKQNTLLGQELRNLYRFYYSEDTDIITEMTKQCREYLKTQKLRKEIHSKRL